MKKPAIVVAGLLIAACGRGNGPVPVTRVGDREIPQGEFERFLRRETGLRVDQIDRAAKDQLREDLLAEVLLSREAERRGMKPPPDALAEEFALLQNLGGGGTPEELEREARRSILTRLYESAVLAPEVTLDPQMVNRLAAEKARGKGGEGVVFRQILAENLQAARKARERILRGESFESVAQEISGTPDKGRKQHRQLALLPPSASQALKQLKPGDLSQPVDVGGNIYLFWLESRQPGPGKPDDRDRGEAEEELFRQNFTRLREARLAQLAGQENVRPPVILKPGAEAYP